MTKPQKRVFWLVIGLCLLYFLIFIIPNSLGAQTEKMLSNTSIDEPVTYPFVVQMLTPAKDFKDLFKRWVFYADYHYGYVFYFWSAVVLLPIRLIYGGHFTDFTRLNVLLLRQLVSVLPMLAAIVLLVYMQTKFKSAWKAVGLLLILLSLRGIIFNNLQWWHPDALSVLSVVLTLFFLQRDALRFGRNFYLAAAACGISVGIKLAGPFFFLTIAAYLLAGLILKRLKFPKMVLLGAAFILIGGFALVASNPFLLFAGARNDLMTIQGFKQTQLAQGYTHDDPAGYTKGPAYWEWTLRTMFASAPFLGLVLFSVLIGCFWGPNKLLNRLILSWIVPYSIYLFYFVAPKPFHYWLPILLPMFSSLLALPEALNDPAFPWFKTRPRVRLALSAVVVVLLVGFFVSNFVRDYSGIIPQFQRALTVEVSHAKK